MKHALKNFVLFAVLFTFAFSINAQDARLIAKQTLPSVVMLEMYDDDNRFISLGSGFFVRTDIVATNYHVIEGASDGFAKIVGQNSSYQIEGIVGLDRRRDLALLKLKGAVGNPLKLADISTIEVGEEVFAVGNPKGLEGTISPGIISGSSIRELEDENLIQITSPISPGSSGGPVVNKKGEVIGIAVSSLKDGQNLNFAVPSSYLALLLAGLKPVSPLRGVSAKVEKKENVVDLDVCGDSPYPFDNSLSDPWDYIFKGQDLLAAEKLLEAKEAFKRAVRKAPKMHEAYFSLFRAYSKLWVKYKTDDCNRRSIIAIKQALIFDPKNVGYRTALGLHLLLFNNEGEAKEAREVFLEGIRIQSKEPKHYVNLASVYIELKKFSEAKDLLLKALKLDSKNADVHRDLGFIYVKEGNKASAIQELNTLEKIDAEKADSLRQYIKASFPL